MGKTTGVEKQSTNEALRAGALRMWNEMKQNWTHFLFRSLMAGIAAATAADAGRTLYQLATGFPPVNWSVSGRWFLMALSGQPYVPNIGAAPTLPNELLAGHIAYYTISILFAAVYLLALSQIFKRKPSVRNGLLFGWITMIFPFFVQMPAMGMGILALNTTTPVLIMLRTVVHHSSFGLGLALGALLADRILTDRAKQ
jgi:hypothetical protein